MKWAVIHQNDPKKELMGFYEGEVEEGDTIIWGYTECYVEEVNQDSKTIVVSTVYTE